MRENSKRSLFVIAGSLYPCFYLQNKKIDAVLGILTQKVRPSRSSKAETVHSCNFEEIRKFFKKRKVGAGCACIPSNEEKPTLPFLWLGLELKFGVFLFLLSDSDCVNVKLFGVLCGNIALGAKINSD
jgi:hypothetical protein